MSRNPILPFGNPAHMLGDLRREFDGLMNRVIENNPAERMASSFGGGFAGGWFNPQANVAETDQRYEVTIDLPGMKAEDIKVEIRGEDLYLSGERHEQREESGKRYHRVERSHGSFQRSIPLGDDVNADEVDASYRDGVLTVQVGKKEPTRGRRIEVKSDGGSAHVATGS